MFNIFRKRHEFDEEDTIKLVAILNNHQKCIIKTMEVIEELQHRIEKLESFANGQIMTKNKGKKK